MKKIYAVKDLLAGEFAPPFMAHNDAVAIRMVQSMLAKVPVHMQKDFVCYAVAEFDEKTGHIEGSTTGNNLPYQVDLTSITKDDEV